MLQAIPPGQRSNLNRAESVQDGGAPYQRRFSATREASRVVVPGHPQSGANAYDTESNTMTIDRMCLAWYWLMLAIACSVMRVLVQ